MHPHLPLTLFHPCLARNQSNICRHIHRPQCIVPYVRGRELSRPVEEILKEIDVLSGYGVREITLLGQNVNSYNSDGDNFASLLKKIADRIKETKSSIGWVRFMSSHPKDLSDEVIKVISEEEVLCHHIHLPAPVDLTVPIY